MVAASFVSGGLNLGVCTVVIKALMKLFGGGHSGDEDKKSVSAAPAASDSGGSNLRPVTLKDLEGFVDYVVRALVDNPDEVKVVTETDGEVKVIKIAGKKTPERSSVKRAKPLSLCAPLSPVPPEECRTESALR